MAQRRVVITGLGAVTSLGNNVNDTWDNVKNGKSGIGPITLFDASKHNVKIAGEVKNFSLDDYEVDHKVSRKMSRFTKFLLGACIEAVKDSGYKNDEIGKENIGIFSGVGIGLSDVIENSYKKYLDPMSGVNRIPPLTAPMSLNNEAAANVAMFFKIHGPAWTLSTTCASGTDSLELDFDIIRNNQLNIYLTGGTDADITGFNIGCYQALSALATTFNDEPTKASRPFDKDRNGFVMAEGAAILVLEEEEHAKKRGARIYAEVAGFGTSTDAYHITAPCPDGSGGVLAMKRASEDPTMKPEETQYYNAHGTPTIRNDSAETPMLKTFFENYA